MALTLTNQTHCPICGKAIRNDEQVFSFPAFVQNTKDPFYQFNDTSVHVECLRKHPLGDRAVQFANQFTLKTRPENRRCRVGGDLIRTFNNYIFIDLLTSNEQEDLYKFNFTTLDKGNLKDWSDRDNFLNAALKFKNEGKWRDLGSNKYLDNLIEMIGD